MGSGYTSMDKAFVRSETNANFFFDLLSKEPGFSDASLDGAAAEEMSGAPSGAGTSAKSEKDNKIQGREVIAAAFNKIVELYPKITEHFKHLGLDLAAMIGPDGKIKADFVEAARKRLMGETEPKTKSLDFMAAQFLIAEQNGVSNKDPVFLEKWEAFSKLPEADRKTQVKTFLEKPENSAKFIRWAFRLSELSLLPFKDQVDILKNWGIGEDKAKSALAPLWQDRGLPRVVAQAALLKGLDLEEEAKALSDEAARAKQGEARLLFRAAAELDNENPLARRRLAIYLVREGKLSSAGFHLGVAIQNESEFRYIMENVAGLQKQDARLYAPAPDAYSFAAEQLILAKRFAEAGQVYSEAAGAAKARGDMVANAAFIEKKMAAEESAKPFEILFSDKDNPVTARLYQALRAQGVPSLMMESAISSDHKISSKEVLAYIGQNWSQDRVQKALKSLNFPTLPWDVAGAKLPYDSDEFRKLDFAGKMVAWHLYDVTELKKKEPVDWSQVLRHQRFAVYYDPENSIRSAELGETLLKTGAYVEAASTFETAFKDGGSKDMALKTKVGMAYFGAGEFEKSRDAYSAVLASNPKDPQGLALRHEANQMLLAKVDEAKDPAKFKELSTAIGADYAMLLTVKPEDEKAKIKEIETALADLHGNKGVQATAVARLAGLKDPEKVGGITKRDVIASVEGLAQNYLTLAEQSYSDPKDVEAVRSAMNGLASETFGVLARFAKDDSDPEIQKMTGVYESYQLIADGKLDEAAEKLKSLGKIPEAQRILAGIEKGKLRLYNTAALEVWEAYNKDLEATEIDESKGVISGIGKSASDVQAKYKLEKELTDAVRSKIETGEAFTLKDALTQISTEGAENLRDRAKFLVSADAMGQDESAIGDVIDLVSAFPPMMERSQRILKKAWALESKGRGLQAALGLYGLVQGVAEEDVLKDRAQKGLDALQGKAGFGRSFEKFLSMSNSGNLAVDIGLMFVAAGLGNLAKIRMLAKLEKAGVSGYKALIIAGGVGLGTEVTALWGANTVKEAMFTDPSKVFTAEHLAKSYGATLIMIGGLKGFGKVGQTIGPKAAKGLGLMTEGGTQLTKGGKALVWGFGHSFGMGGMIATSHINQGLKLTPKPVGGWKEGLVHDVLGYVQFAVAHGAADRVFRGKMQEVSMRQHTEIAYRESILLAKGHADAMGFKADAMKIEVDEGGKLKVDGKPLEEFDAESKAIIEGQLTKTKDGKVENQTINVDGGSRRLLVTLMTDAGLNRPGFSGMSLRRLVQAKNFVEANAYLEKYSVPLRFGKAGEVIAMGSQPGSPHALLGIVSEGGEVKPITEEQIKDLTPEPATPPKKRPPPPPKRKAKKAANEIPNTDSPIVPARKELPAPKPAAPDLGAEGTAQAPKPKSNPPRLLPPAPHSPIVSIEGWAEGFARVGEKDFAGKETMFRDGYNALLDRTKQDPRFQDPKFRKAAEKNFNETLDALKPILEKTVDAEARTHLGQALFIKVMKGELTLANARELAAGAQAGHYRVEKSPGYDYNCVPLYYGVEVKPGTSLLVGKNGKELHAIPGDGLGHTKLPDGAALNFEFRQQDGKTTAILEGRAGEATIEVYDAKRETFRALKTGEKVELQDAEPCLIAGKPYVFRATESLAKDLKLRQELLDERAVMFKLAGETAKTLKGSPEWQKVSLKYKQKRDAFAAFMERDAFSYDGSSTIAAELLGLAGGNTPFAPLARQALKGEIKAADYRQAQNEIASKLVEGHRAALEEVESYLSGLFMDDAIEHRLTHELHDAQGQRLENPHARMKDAADVAPKIARRGWLNLEPMTDYAGARIVVKNTNGAEKVAADIEKHLQVRDAYNGQGQQEMDILGQEHIDGKETMVVTIKKDKDNPDRLHIGSDSGYRAMHIVVEVDGKPVEIQIQTESIFKWGKIQHALIYKNENLPAETRKQLNEYCRSAAAYLTALENGPSGNRPDQPVLVGDLPAKLKSEIESDLGRMSKLMDHYEKVAEDDSQHKTRVVARAELEKEAKPVDENDVTRKIRVSPPPLPNRAKPDKGGVPERRGDAGGSPAADLNGLTDSKPVAASYKPSELRFKNGKVLKLSVETKVAVLGSKEGADIRVEGDKVAAEHAEIIRDSAGRSWLRALHGNPVYVLREGNWVNVNKDGNAKGYELLTGSQVKVGSHEFTWQASPNLETTGSVSRKAPVPPPLPRDWVVQEDFKRHVELTNERVGELMNLLEVGDSVLSGESSKWVPSYVNSAIPERTHVPVMGYFERMTHDQFVEARKNGTLADSPPATFHLNVRGKQRAADLEARLRAEYGKDIVVNPSGEGWLLRNSSGKAQAKIVFHQKPLSIVEPAEARKLFQQFEKDSLQQLQWWSTEQGPGFSMENSYSFRLLLMVGPTPDGKGGVRFGATFEEAVRRYETETDPVKKARAGETLATLCSYVQDVPGKVEEFKLLRQVFEWRGNRSFQDGLFKAKEAGGELATESKVAYEALHELQRMETELRNLGEILRRDVKAEDRRAGEPNFDAYQAKAQNIQETLNAIRAFSKKLEDAGLKRKGPPPLPAKADIQGASDTPTQDLRSFDAATVQKLKELGIANTEKLRDSNKPEYVEAVVATMHHLLSNPAPGHPEYEMLVNRTINGLRAWERKSGQKLEWLDDYLKGFRRDRVGVPMDIPSAVMTPPESLLLSADDQARLKVKEITPDNVLDVVEAIRTGAPELDKIGGFSAFRLNPADESVLWRILQNYGPYIQHKRPELGAYLHALFEVRQVYGVNLESGEPASEPGKGRIPERRGEASAAKQSEDATDPVGFKYAEEIQTNTRLGQELHSIARPKPSLTKVIPGLTKELEMKFERGARVQRWPNGRNMLVEPSSGSDTVVVNPATPAESSAYVQWKERRGFVRVPPTEGVKAWKALDARAKELGIKLYEGSDATEAPLRGKALEEFVRKNGGQIGQLKELLDLLPASFYGEGRIKRIFLKSPRQEDAHFSAFDAANGSLYLYSGAFNGSRRNMAALFLHEAGHSNAVRYRMSGEGDPQIPWEVRREVAAHHKTLSEMGAHFGLDWAGGKAERLRLQGENLEEFLSELQLAYVTAGPQLRAHIRSFPEGSAQRQAWDYLYTELSGRVFGGMEYDYPGSKPPPLPFGDRPTLKMVRGGKPDSVPPSQAPAKGLGPVPTNIVVPDAYLEKAQGLDHSIESMNWGGIAASRHPGFGPKGKSPNEDRYSVSAINMPDGSRVIRSFVIDGMGGQGEGKGEFAGVFIRYVVEHAAAHPGMKLEDAILMADRQLIEHPVHRDIAARNGLDKAPGAVVVGMEVHDKGMGNYNVKFANVGDSEAFLMDSNFNVDPQAYTAREFGTNAVLPRGQTLFARVNPLRNAVDQAVGSRQEGKLDIRVETATHAAKRGQIVVAGSDGLFENFTGKSEMAELLRLSGAKTAEQMQTVLINETLIRMAIYDRFIEEKRTGTAITHEDYAQAYQKIWGATPPAGKWRYEGLILTAKGLILDPSVDPLHDKAKGYRGSFKFDNVTALVQVLGEKVTSKPKDEDKNFRPQAILGPAPRAELPEPTPMLKRLMEIKR